MRLGFDRRIHADRVDLPEVERPSGANASELRVGLGPSGQLQVRPRSQPSAVVGFFTAAVAAVILATGIPAPAQAQGRAVDTTQVQTESPLRAGYARLLAADANGDGKWIGTRYGNELSGLDPLARAIYDYVDYVNPRGHISLWGAATAGDYQEGGLGLGYTTRPKHMTGNRVLLADDLHVGIRRLEARIDHPLGSDQVGEDLRAIMDATKLGADQIGEVHAATERLLDHVRQETGQKELATRDERALLTDAELLASLPDGSLERAIAEAAAGHGPIFFARELQHIGANGRALGLGPRQEVGVVGAAQQQYLLQIAKRAMEAKLLAAVSAAL